MMTDPDQAKRALRGLLRHARPLGDLIALTDRLLTIDVPPASVIAAVWPLPGEPDLVPAWTALHRRGHAVVLPETTPAGQALVFRRWTPGDAMLAGRFGTRYPPGPVTRPDIVFVPLLAWDATLHRLGYGGGYYDRTLAGLPHARGIGFGFEAQRLDRVPVGPYDVPLDSMVTETRILFAKDRRI